MKGCLKFFLIGFAILSLISLVRYFVFLTPEQRAAEREKLAAKADEKQELPLDPQELVAAKEYTAKMWQKGNPHDRIRFMGSGTVVVEEGLNSLEPRKTAMRAAALFAQQLDRVPVTALVMDGERELAAHTFHGPLLADSLKIRTTQRLLLDHPVIGWTIEEMAAKYGKAIAYDPASKRLTWPGFVVEIHDGKVQDIQPPSKP